MTRPRIAPRYINIETPVVMNKRLPASVKVTYMYIKALAWGDKDVIFTAEEFFELFGIPRSTLYRHLSLLAKYTVLRYRSSGSRTTGVVFVELLVDSNKPDPSEDQSERKSGDFEQEEIGVSKLGQSYSSSSLKESKDFKDSLPEEEEYSSINNHIPGSQERARLKSETASLKNEIRSPKNETGFHRKKKGGYGNGQVRSPADSGDGRVFKLYEANIGLLTPMIADALQDAEAEYPQEWICEAIQIAVDYNKRSWAYCKTILARWGREGKDSGRLKGDQKSEMSEVERLLLDLDADGDWEDDG